MSPNTFSQTLLLKKKDEEISNFLPQPWTDPFSKMQILRRLTRLVFYLKRHQKIFPGLPCLKRNDE